MLLALNSARLIGFMPRASFTAGTRKVPSELSDEPICEWVAVSRGGKRLATQTISGRGSYRMTAAATLAFAEALVGPHASNHGKLGLRSIDELITLADIGLALEQRGITIRRQPVRAVARAA
jgi:hypothetical protein